MQTIETLEHRRLLAVIGEADIFTGAQIEDPDVRGAAPAGTLTFDNAYTDPIVVLGPATSNDGSSVIGRLANPTATGVDVYLDEWDHDDGIHGTESLGYVVLERGVHTLANGQRVVAGSTPMGLRWVNDIDLGMTFSSTPVIFATVVNSRDPRTMAVRINDVTASSFDMMLQLEEAAPVPRGGGALKAKPAIVNWIAIEPGPGTAGVDFAAGRTETTVDQTGEWLPFGVRLAPDVQPVTLGQIQTFNDSDPAALRYTTANRDGFYGYIEEEVSKDAEVTHGNEVVGYVGFDVGDIRTANVPIGDGAYAFADSFAATVPSLTQAEMDAEIAASYDQWKARNVTSSGANGFRRVKGENFNFGGQSYPNATVSEGIGYGMLLAVYNDDQALFDDLWNYAQFHFSVNGEGLMNWLIDQNGVPVQNFNNATDGDLDIAFALVAAEQFWGGYRQDALDIIDAILTFNINPDNSIRGGIVNSPVATNLSYAMPGWFRVFADFSGVDRWNDVTDRFYEILDLSEANQGNNFVGLFPGDTTQVGVPYVPGEEFYGYNACRIPWRIVADYIWYGTDDALQRSADFNTFFTDVGWQSIRDGYALDGTAFGGWFNSGSAAYVGPAAASMLTSDNPDLQRQAWDATVAADFQGYYMMELRLMTMMMMAGRWQNPLASATPSGTFIAEDPPTFRSPRTFTPTTLFADGPRGLQLDDLLA
ncbi:MAG: glycosyl hydrolase family 8 [Planctomycetota bacterium]